LSGTSRAGTPPKNSSASIVASLHACWSNRITGRTNMYREHDNTITNAQIVTRRPPGTALHRPSLP